MSSPFSNKTPESYFAGLRRKDSKNALTTCRGVTDKGRACRRALASPKNSSKFDGAVVITKNADDPAVFFCHQHKGQADALLLPDDEGSVISIKGRHSLEDAFRSLGLDDVDEEPEPSASPSPAVSPDIQIPEPSYRVATEPRRPTPVLQTQPLTRAPPYERPGRKQREYRHEKTTPTQPRQRRYESPKPRPSKSSLSLLSCCFGSEPVPRGSKRTESYRDRYAAPRPVESGGVRPDNRKYDSPGYIRNTPMDGRSSRNNQKSPKTPSVELRRKEVPSHRKSDSGVALSTSREPKDVHYPRIDARLDIPFTNRTNLNVYRDPSPTPAPRQSYRQFGDPKSDSILQVSVERPGKSRSKSSPDAQQLNRIHGEWPPALPRNATDKMRITYAKLLTVMSEPPSKTDTQGYVYIFWQTEQEQTDDETSAVTSIISAPKLDRGLQRQETVLQRRFFQTSANARLSPSQQQNDRTIFLKIGRAVNVHQRLNQWKKQCEYEISLLRSYPYEGKAPGLKQVPNVVKVERLIHLHLEMQGQRVTKGCRCGTEHKEWFEVAANAKAVREVDEIVSRWVRWSEERFG